MACVMLVVCDAASGIVLLPDHRAWEMVSPLEKDGGDVVGIDGDSGGGIVQASADGDAITYVAESSFGKPQGAPAFGQYIATRNGSTGWSSQNVTPPAYAGTYGLAGTGGPYKAFSSDLSAGLLLNGETGAEGEIENPPLESSPAAPPGYQNFYLRSSVGGGLDSLLNSGHPPTEPATHFYMVFQGVSPDLRHVVVSSGAALTPGATAENDRPNLYEWTGGVLQPVNVLPETSTGATVLGAELGSGGGESRSVSDDGSRVFWSHVAGVNEALYVREIGVKTIRINTSQGGPVVGAHEFPAARFQTASADGSMAFYTSRLPLTGNANTGPPCGFGCERNGNDLYRFDVQNEVLEDVTPDSLNENGASVQGVLGASEDGSYVYFVAGGVLSGANGEGHSPALGGDNLYVWHEDPATHERTTTFIAALAANDESPTFSLHFGEAHDWSGEVLRRTARVTPSGHQVVFMSEASLTGYNNIDAVTQSRDQEVYLYDAESTRLACASCNPTGAQPLGPSGIPGGTPYEHRLEGGAAYQSRVLSEDGSRVFFESDDALVPQDTNGQRDVYEYENGHPYLISGGTDSGESAFVDASANGNDVFFLTAQQLVRGDTDHLVDLYDARVDGGIAEPASPPPCAEEGCKPSVSQAPTLESTGSGTFVGAGNLTPVVPVTSPKPKPKSKVKRTTKHKPKKRSKRRHRPKGHKAARSRARPRAGLR